MNTVLTIDLDVFVSPVRRGVQGSKRPSNSEYKLIPETSIRSFLESNLSFSVKTRWPASFIKTHDRAFMQLRQEIESGKISSPFALVNADAHSDLGMGGTAWKAILTDLIIQPVNQRPDHMVTKTKMNEGNWVAFALACQWISEYTLVKPGPSQNDLFPYYFIDGRNYSNIQFHSFNETELNKFQGIEMDEYPSYFGSRKSQEPVIKFCEIEPAKFFMKSKPDKIIICHSPLFIPKSADSVIDLMKEYFEFESE